MREKVFVFLLGFAFVITGTFVIFILSKVGMLFVYKLIFYGLGGISIFEGYRLIIMALKNI
jgi:hypothetical protein